MEELKKALAKIAPVVIAYILAVSTYYLHHNPDVFSRVLVAIVEVFK